MKGFFGILAFFLLLANIAVAQETYSISATAGQVASLAEIIAVDNVTTCITWGFSPGCTQGDVCIAAGATGGASCTAAQARAKGVRLWPATQAGREEYVIFSIAAPEFQSRKARYVQVSKSAYCWWFDHSNQTVKDAECTKVGFSSGCSCPAQ